MKVMPTAIADVLTIKPEVFGDERGFFYESFNQRDFNRAIGQSVTFVQDNCSNSAKNVLRGLHYQIQQPQGKLVFVVRGAVFEVIVDLRKSSITFGKWVGIELTEENHHQTWVPPGFAHGFVVTSEFADICYKTTAFYAPEFERCISWNDPELAIDWQLTIPPLLSSKDKMGTAFSEAELYS